jgi:hypothetical protein
MGGAGDFNVGTISPGGESGQKENLLFGARREMLTQNERRQEGEVSTASGEGADFFEEGGRGEGLKDFDAFDASPGGFDFRAAYNLISRPVSPFHQNIGKESGDNILWSSFVEDEDRVDTFETGQNLGTLLLRNDRTRGSFEGANTPVAVDADDQKITKGPGGFKAADVARVKQIETAIGEDNLATVAFLASKPQNRLFQSEHRWRQGNSLFDRSESTRLRPETKVYHDEFLPRRGTWLPS